MTEKGAPTFEVRYWLESGDRYATWLTTPDRSEAVLVANDLQRRRKRNRIEVVEVAL